MYSKILTVLSILLSWIIYIFSHLSPRSSRICICIGWHQNKDREIFADNSKYFFLYLSRHHPTVNAIWIAKDNTLATMLRAAGYRAYSINSFAGAYYSLRAKYTFVDAFMLRQNWRYCGGSRIIQLWHGKGMKKTGHDSPYSLAGRSRYVNPNLFVNFYRLVASSPHTAALMASTFRTPIEKVMVTGLPRNDVLLRSIPGSEIDENEKLKRAILEAKNHGAKKIILYAPTFRPDGSNPLDALRLSELNQFLQQRGYWLLITLHPKFSSKTITVDTSFNNIQYIPAGFDSYPGLNGIDILITDYSSLYIDFLLLDKQIIFYTYDLEEYRVHMGLHEDFDTLTPGPHPGTFEALLAAIDEGGERYAKKRAFCREKLFSYSDDKASERIAALVLGNH